MQPIKEILAPFNPSETDLLEYLCDEIKEDSLYRISEADYGDNSEVYLKNLKRIHDRKKIEKIHFDRDLSEVVNLTRWSVPVWSKDKYYSEAQLGNLEIAFSCAILLSIRSEWYYNRMGENSTVIRLVQVSEPLSILLPEISEKVASLLAWRVTENETDTDEVPYFIFGLILVALTGDLCSESILIKLIDALISFEEAVFNEQKVEGFNQNGKWQWLFRISPFNQLHEDWIAYSSFLAQKLKSAQSPELQGRLKTLIYLLNPYQS